MKMEIYQRINKILLINSNTENAPYPVAPLGLCILATAVENVGYTVQVFDGLWNQKDLEDYETNNKLAKVIKAFQPDVIGVSVRNIDDIVMQSSVFYIDEVERLCINPIKKHHKGITILGGAGYSLFPEILIKRWQFDYGIIGPGEEIFIQLLQHLTNNLPTLNIPNLLKLNPNGEIEKSQSTIVIPPSKKLEIPYSRIDTHLKYEPYLMRSAYPIQTKRGCALRCLYCSYPVLEGKTYQLRSVEDVVDEIEEVFNRIPNIVFEFVDSTFNHPPRHAENICKEIIKRDFNSKYPNKKLRLRTMGINPSGVSFELIDLMKKSGFTQIDCTPDSGSEIMLKSLRKGFSRKKLEESAKILREAQMPTMWFFVLGGPGETDETLDETFEFIHNFIEDTDLVHITEGLRIYPKTGLAKIALEEGYVKSEEELLEPLFYVSKSLGKERLAERVIEFTKAHFNCVRSVDSTPSKEMLQQALEMRKKENLMEEPMFKTLLRVKKANLQQNTA
jgi:radical SAM superfamily enzyme YgiQ (UPF0313 family)